MERHQQQHEKFVFTCLLKTQLNYEIQPGRVRRLPSPLSDIQEGGQGPGPASYAGISRGRRALARVGTPPAPADL